MVSQTVQFVGAVLGLIVLVWVVNTSIILINNTERGVLIRSEEFKRLLEPGLHVIHPFGRTIETYPRVEMTGTQPCPVSTADGRGVDVAVQYQFEITDVERAAGYEGWDDPDAWERALSREVYETTEAVVGDLDLAAVRESEQIERAVSDALGDLAPEMGVKINTVAVTEVGERDDTE